MAGVSDASAKRPVIAITIVAAIVFGVAWFARLGARDLAHPDEGRYAEIPREMAESGDWVTPRLDGLRYFEKPPLQYWATAASYELFGEGNATARLWPALTGFLTVFWTMFVGRKLFSARAGLFAGLFLGSSLLWVAMGHTLTLDMGFSALLAVALGSLAIAQSRREDSSACRAWMLLAWIALAGAVLSKGPVAIVLLGGALGVYALWQRDRGLLRHLHLAIGLPLFFVLTVPWFVLVESRNPGFSEFFFVHEHLQRYATDSAGRVHPWWTFLPVVVVGSSPWLVSAVASLVRPRFDPRDGSRFDAGRLLWVACVWTILFFSCSHSKLIPYVLPIFPALALLVGRSLAEGRSPRADAAAAIALGAVFLAVALVPSLVERHGVSEEDVLACSSYVLGASALLVLGGSIAAAWPGSSTRPALVLSTAGFGAFLLLNLGYAALPENGSSRRVANAIREAVPPDAPIYIVQHYDQPLPFYLGRTVDLVHERGELEYGLSLEPQREIQSVDGFVAAWERLEQGAALLPRALFLSMLRDGVPMRRIHEDPKFVAVARR
jgi:4-amino-4-deoxy-L-arabinose transferase-like glycosyltransferase